MSFTRTMTKAEIISDDTKAYASGSIGHRRYQLVTLFWPQSQHLVNGIVRKSKLQQLLKLNMPYEYKGETLLLRRLIVKERHRERTLRGKNPKDYQLIDWFEFLPLLNCREAQDQIGMRNQFVKDFIGGL